MSVRPFISTVLLALCVMSVSAAGAQQPEQEPTPKPTPATAQEPVPPAAKKNARPEGEAAPTPEPFDKMTPEQVAGHWVTLDTEAGAVVIEMLPEAAPESARNFLNLSATGAFDTTTFSRVVKGFVVQGGNLATRERLSQELIRRASRKVPDEPNAVKHLRGVVSLARPAEPNAATTHFFILLNDAPHLDGSFAAFGRVTSGMDVVDKVAAGELDGEKPKAPVRIRRAAVSRCAAPPSYSGVRLGATTTTGSEPPAVAGGLLSPERAAHKGPPATAGGSDRYGSRARMNAAVTSRPNTSGRVRADPQRTRPCPAEGREVVCLP